MHAGMTKLIFNDSWSSALDFSVKLIEDARQLEKSAATIFGCDYADVQPDKDHVGLHVVALGDLETYGANRNGDTFPKKACQQYHHTFVKYGNLFQHHKNNDPEKALGRVVKSAYNEPMGRVELFIHAHKEKAKDHLDKLAKDGEIPVSMACRVMFDRCSICNTLRKNASDPNMCDHVRNDLGRIYDDGRIVATHNDEPKFFDISFVTRPADRIAWSLKSAGVLPVRDSIKLAEDAGVWTPDELALTSPEAQARKELMRKLAAYEDLYVGRVRQSQNQNPTATERYYKELLKAASSGLPDSTLEDLRRVDPREAFTALAKLGIIMDIDSFYKYALGADYAEVAAHIPGARQLLRTRYGDLLKSAQCQAVCNEQLYDTHDDRYESELLDRRQLVTAVSKLAAQFSLLPVHSDERIIGRMIHHEGDFRIEFDKQADLVLNDTQIKRLIADKYAAYKLAAVAAVIKYNPEADESAILAQAVAQNLIR